LNKNNNQSAVILKYSISVYSRDFNVNFCGSQRHCKSGLIILCLNYLDVVILVLFCCSGKLGVLIKNSRRHCEMQNSI